MANNFSTFSLGNVVLTSGRPKGSIPGEFLHKSRHGRNSTVFLHGKDESRQESRQNVGIRRKWNRESRQTSRHFGGRVVIGEPTLRHPAMMPPGILNRTFIRTFCPGSAASSVLATILATKCRGRRSAAPENPAIYPAELAGCRYPERKPDMIFGFAYDLGTTAHTDIE
jgi:hypothetical protein